MALLCLRAHHRCTVVVESATPRHPECLHTHMSGLDFPPTAIGESATTQLELCNGHRREITVIGMYHICSVHAGSIGHRLNFCLPCRTVCAVAVKPPFAVRHQRFRIRSRSRVRLPVMFNPGGFIPAHLDRISMNPCFRPLLMMICHCDAFPQRMLHDQRQTVLFNMLFELRQTCQDIQK